MDVEGRGLSARSCCFPCRVAGNTAKALRRRQLSTQSVCHLTQTWWFRPLGFTTSGMRLRCETLVSTRSMVRGFSDSWGGPARYAASSLITVAHGSRPCRSSKMCEAYHGMSSGRAMRPPGPGGIERMLRVVCGKW